MDPGMGRAALHMHAMGAARCIMYSCKGSPTYLLVSVATATCCQKADWLGLQAAGRRGHTSSVLQESTT